ncbi:hypothetical protein HZA96_00405 [Candidatus Woesearchaeota archaeon]|nr:hypothetical protein [Candidatus Woesearchaeota archaeon]
MVIIKSPTREYCEQLFKEYKVPYNIKIHCYKVNQVAVFLAKKLSESGQDIDIVLVDRLSLLHDLMKAVALKKLDKNPLFKADPTAEEIAMCEKLKKQYAGMHETQITSAILKDKYFEFAKCIENEGDSSIFTSEKRVEEQIVHYSDWRVFVDEIIPLQQRIDDLFKRYNGKIMIRGLKLWKKRVADEFAVEKQIFNKLAIKPDDLSKILK